MDGRTEREEMEDICDDSSGRRRLKAAGPPLTQTNGVAELGMASPSKSRTHPVDAYRPEETLLSGSLTQQGATPLQYEQRISD